MVESLTANQFKLEVLCFRTFVRCVLWDWRKFFKETIFSKIWLRKRNHFLPRNESFEYTNPVVRPLERHLWRFWPISETCNWNIKPTGNQQTCSTVALYQCRLFPSSRWNQDGKCWVVSADPHIAQCQLSHKTTSAVGWWPGQARVSVSSLFYITPTTGSLQHPSTPYVRLRHITRSFDYRYVTRPLSSNC